MATTERLLEAFRRQRQILNEMARLCALIEVELTGKLTESEKAQKETDHVIV